MCEKEENILEIKTASSPLPIKHRTFFKSRETSQPTKNPTTDHVIQFRIIQNSANGDCLFQALAEFIQKTSSKKQSATSPTPVLVSPAPPFNFNFTSDKFHDSYNLRKACVKYITSPDKYHHLPLASSSYTLWRKFRTDIKFNFETQIDFFKTYNPQLYSQVEIIDTDPLEVIARQKYSDYMSKPGTYGTATEIMAAMELFKFSVTLIKQNSRNDQLYEVFHLDSENKCNVTRNTNPNTLNKNQHTKITNRAYMLFTGNPNKGHFELLDPISDCSSLLLPSKAFKVDQKSKLAGSGRYLCLVLCENTENSQEMQTHGLFSKMKGYCTSILFNRKRTFEEANLNNVNDNNDSDSSTLLKRRRIDPEENDDDDPNIAIRKANLNPNECLLLLEFFAVQVSQLRDEFMMSLNSKRRNHNIFHIVEGVTESRILNNGNLNTAFIQFQPKAKTEFCVSNFNVNYLLYQGASITLWTSNTDSSPAGETKDKEVDSRVESEPFELLKGSQYALENHHRYALLLRIFWRN